MREALTLACRFAVLAALSVAAAAQPVEPKLTVRLLAAHDAIPLGGQTQLAVVISVEKPWHMYHAVTLDTGMATKVRFSGPAGVTVGQVRFPAPALKSQVGLEALELPSEFTCIADLSLAADAKVGGELRIGVEVSGLACIEQCVPVSAKAALAIPVRAERGSSANADAFKAAEAKLPKSLSEAPYLKGSAAVVSVPALTPSDKGEIAVTLKVQSGHHIQDRNPGNEDLIATRVWVESIPGVSIAEESKQTWPEPKTRETPGVGKVREHGGEVKIVVPFSIEDSLESGPVELRVLVRYQCCNDKGECYPPEIAEAVVRFEAKTRTPADGARALYRVASASADGGPVDAQPPAPVAAAAPAKPAADSSVGESAPPREEVTFLGAILAALLGGLILNVMPCVLPVISIKIVGFVQQAKEDRGRLLKLGFAFGLGVLAWFWLLGGITALGSGPVRAMFQNPLQTPAVTISLAVVIFLMGLNLFGVFEFNLPGSAACKLDEYARREGYPGAFFKGFLATILGTACTAPFLVTALGYTLTQPPVIAFAVFTAAGIGMAAPYVILSADPRLLRFVPKPGAWMCTFKQAMGFLLMGTVVWLLWVLRKPMGRDGVVLTMGFLTSLALAAWLIGRIRHNWSRSASAAAWTGALAIAVGGFWLNYIKLYDPSASREHARVAVDPAYVDKVLAEVAASDWQKIPWVAYQPGLAEAIAARGKTVFVDYTADWCWTCKTNLHAAVDVESTRGVMRELGVVPIEADYTENDAAIRADLDRWGNTSVPLNLLYPAGKPDAARKLATVLTPGYMQDELRRATPGGSRVARAAGE